MYPCFVGGILNRANRIQLFVLCIENYIMNIILKSVLVTKSAVFLTSQDICFKYRIVAKHFKLEYFQNCDLN